MDEYCPRSSDGRHKPFSQTFRLPVGWVIEYEAQKHDDPNLPRPLRYWEIETCGRCGHEKHTPHGFTPRCAQPQEQPHSEKS